MSQTQQDLLNVNLPKWPGFAVEGTAVSIYNAAEILIRTDGFYFSCNDHEWARQLYEAIGVPLTEQAPNYRQPDWGTFHETRVQYRVLDLEYITNRRIASAYVGGPHGWCNWDGAIGCNSYNIGKWPSVENVLDEWRIIATAFPFLDLRCQLYSGETCEDGIVPLVEYVVGGGRVELVAPGEPIQIKDDVADSITAMMTRDVSRERGCTIEQFKFALAVVRRRRIA